MSIEHPKPPSYNGLRPASASASKTGRGNRGSDTQPEILLRRALWKRGARYRVHYKGLIGRPDIVFVRQQVAIFCDGDFWHGRSWDERKARLARGSNPGYWIAKIERNIYRDGQVDEALRDQGWRVIRFWESDIRKSPDAVAEEILDAIRD